MIAGESVLCRRSDCDGLVPGGVLPRRVPEEAAGQQQQQVLHVRQPGADVLHVVTVPGGAHRLLLRIDGDEGVRAQVVYARRRDHVPRRRRAQWCRPECAHADPGAHPPWDRRRLRQSG